MTLNFS